MDVVDKPQHVGVGRQFTVNAYVPQLCAESMFKFTDHGFREQVAERRGEVQILRIKRGT
jgi:hypothetical protein